MDRKLRTVVTAVAPVSVGTWFSAFAEPGAPVIFTGEQPNNAAATAALISLHAQGCSVRLLSSHATFRRDLAIARLLSTAGFSVQSQTPRAVRSALDKVFAKQLLASQGIPTPAWGVGPPTGMPLENLLCKARNSTQSSGITWAKGVHEWPSHCYWEEYVDGVEYSVVLFRERGRVTLLPSVWKGAVQRDLLPPWRRLRLCPAPEEKPGLLEELANLGRVFADAIDMWGFGEVEFVVDNTGKPYVLEVNPRICGTLRIAAMAASMPIFDSRVFPGDFLDVPATYYAAELPHEGPSILRPDVIATSRITCRAPSRQATRELLEQYQPVSASDISWPLAWSHS